MRPSSMPPDKTGLDPAVSRCPQALPLSGGSLSVAASAHSPRTPQASLRAPRPSKPHHCISTSSPLPVRESDIRTMVESCGVIFIAF
ncbi:hypothetical protein NDU88_006889 [Pleurodeles waltl]|uniref:Uncharacterized protein n=1 Tax=Pleurodeles waltl TaxID=8319 RepID=A0AAV7PJN3_PLEWA|nr:hypothetical protein NDU88_006889 [Pleurodeles waltl]